MNADIDPHKQALGEEAEQAFLEWLKSMNHGFLFSKGNRAVFPPAYRGKAKQPDFMIFLKHVSTMAVDVHGVEIVSGPGGDAFHIAADAADSLEKFHQMSSKPTFLCFISRTEDYSHAYFYPVMAGFDRFKQVEIDDSVYYVFPTATWSERKLELCRLEMTELGHITDIFERL